MSTFSPEQLQELNSIITSRSESLKNSIDGLKTMLERQALESKTAQAPKEKESTPEDMTIRQRLEQLEARNRQLEEKERVSNLHNLAMQGLKQYGINQNSELAMAYLKEGLHYDKLSGQPYLTIDGIPRPLNDALTMFAESKHGQFLRDPVPAAGAGQKTPVSISGNPANNAPTSVEQKLSKGISATNYLTREEMTEAVRKGLGSDLKF